MKMDRRQMLMQSATAAGLGVVAIEALVEAMKHPFTKRMEAPDFPIMLKPDEITRLDVWGMRSPSQLPSLANICEADPADGPLEMHWGLWSTRKFEEGTRLKFPLTVPIIKDASEGAGIQTAMRAMVAGWTGEIILLHDAPVDGTDWLPDVRQYSHIGNCQVSENVRPA